jgi:hypothetical protein
MSMQKLLRNLQPGESFFTKQLDRTVGATASRAGIRVSTENFWAIPVRAPHATRSVRALRICCVTRQPSS